MESVPRQSLGGAGGAVSGRTLEAISRFCLDKPELPEEPTPEEIAPILRRTIRETVRQMSRLELLLHT